MLTIEDPVEYSIAGISQLSGTLLGGLLSMPGALSTALLLALPLLSALLYLVLGFAGWFSAAFILWLLARLWGQRGEFFPWAAAVGYALVPKMIGVAVAAGLVAWGLQEELPWSPHRISLGGLLQPAPGLLADFMAQIDVFALWSLGLLVRALRIFYGLAAGRAAALVGIYWAIFLGAVLGFFALSRALSQALAA